MKRIDNKIISINSMLQYWFYEINIRILAANQQKWGWSFANQQQNFNADIVKPTL